MSQLSDATAGNNSFSRQLPGLQLAWDSTSLGSFKTCPRWYYYSIVQGWEPRSQSPHLTFGLLVHSARERYQHQRAAGLQHEPALASVIERLLLQTFDTTLGRPWTSEHPTKNRLTLLRTVVWYLDRWYGPGSPEGDPLQTLIRENGKPAVELSFSFNSGFAASNGEMYQLCGHFDRLATLGGKPVIDDCKTTGYALSRSWFDQFSPHNQFSLYTLAGKVVYHQPVETLIVDGIQVAAGFSRFQREMVSRPAAVVDEWLEELQDWFGLAEHFARNAAAREEKGQDPAGAWPMADTQCGRYGGCPARSVCSRSPAARQGVLELEFKRRVWDPLQRRGDI